MLTTVHKFSIKECAGRDVLYDKTYPVLFVDSTENDELVFGIIGESGEIAWIHQNGCKIVGE